MDFILRTAKRKLPLHENSFVKATAPFLLSGGEKKCRFQPFQTGSEWKNWRQNWRQELASKIGMKQGKKRSVSVSLAH